MAAYISMGIEAEVINKVHEGSPHTADRIAAGDIDLVINTVGSDASSVRDSAAIRRSALLHAVPYFTTVAGAISGVGAIRALQMESIGVRALQDIHASGID